MSTLDEVKAAAQATVDAVNALEVTPATQDIKEIDVVETDGTVEKFVPETPAA